MAGVKVAQVTLGVDVLGLNDLEKGKERPQDLPGLGLPLPTPPLPHFHLLSLSPFPSNMDTIIPAGIGQDASWSLLQSSLESQSHG